MYKSKPLPCCMCSSSLGVRWGNMAAALLRTGVLSRDDACIPPLALRDGRDIADLRQGSVGIGVHRSGLICTCDMMQ